MVKITIGLMACNEESYIEETLLSLLDQGIGDFELIVGDNASTDKTSRLIEAIARKDGRVRHLLRPVNIGALENMNDLVRQATGEYFIFAGAHDLWSDGYLERLAQILDEHPRAACAYAKTKWIDEGGAPLDQPTPAFETGGIAPHRRLVGLSIMDQHAIHGLMRTEMVKQTRLQLPILGSGEIFLQELAQIGEFIFVPSATWYRRAIRIKEPRLNQLARYKKNLFRSRWQKLRFSIFPSLQFLWTYFSLPAGFKSLTPFQRLRLLPTTFFIVAQKLPKSLAVDLIWGLRTLLNSLSGR